MKPTTLTLATLFAIASVALAQNPSPTKNPSSTAPSPIQSIAPSPAKVPPMAPSPAQTTPPPNSYAPSPTVAPNTSTGPSEAEMMKQMMEMAKLNENHKLLAQTAGSYSYVVKMWMDPKGNPTESKGTATRKAILDGRYVTGEYSGVFKMPGANGKMTDMNFKGMSLDGYDNAKQKFVATWIDNMGTAIMMMEGTYDAATKTFTYTGEYDMMPNMKSKVREVIKMTDKGMSMEYFEDRGQGETKSMEITYTRKK
jgi:hypothetical protein